ncbi:MAG: hypothetical protein AAGB51_06125 [Planctomycetota bacterium]
MNAADPIRTVAALYVDVERGPYASMAGVECYGVERDARLYDGPHPVVAHPPCNAWGSYRMFRLMAQRRHGWGRDEMDRDAIGMQCGPHAVEQVRRFGGVLEHPAGSQLWPYCTLPAAGGMLSDRWGGVTVEIDQGAFGHPCPKRTWLYVVGAEPAELMGEPRCDPGGRVQSQWSTKRHLTPGTLAELLIQLARRCEPGVQFETDDREQTRIGA